MRNDSIEFSISLSNGKVAWRTITNRATEETFELPTDDVALEFEHGEVFLPSSGSARVIAHSESDLQIQLRQNDLCVQVHYHLPVGKQYLRKRVSVRQTDGQRRLFRADLDNWMGVRQDWRSMTADQLKFGSHPIYSETVFAGVEFVCAFNEYGRDGFVLRSRPGGIHIGSDWLSLNSTVVGVSRPGTIREAFLEYLEDVRLAPPKLVGCYNSWWTLPIKVKQEDNLSLIRILKDKLYDQHGVFFDFVTTDMGWSDPRSIWEIDRAQLPNAFEDIRGIVESAAGRLGLWISPSEMYPPACDYQWLENRGYVVLRQDEKGIQEAFAVSLADPKYRNAVKEQVLKLVRGSNLGHIKYDGFVAEESNPHNDLLPGVDSVEPLAHSLLDLLDISKKANPNLVTELTCLNSIANYISPWILKHSDSVWGNAGGDCPPGMNPAPDYRESHTNAREYYIFSSLREFWLPQNAVQYFDIVHCDQATGFANHAAMAFGRGRFFVATYLNPKFMTADDWRIYAGLLKWARANKDILRNTVVLPSRVEIGEPYVYAHWLGLRGILAVRNPSNATRGFELNLGKARAPKSLSNAVCYIQYPYRKGIARQIGANSIIRLKLAPWELLFLEIVAEQELREPVAIGARWYGEAGETRLVADPARDEMEWLEPQSAPRTLRVSPRSESELGGQVVSQSARLVPENQRLAAKSGRVPTTAFELECEVRVPTSASAGRLLLLLEYPGNKHWPSRCEAMLNRRPVSLAESSSALREEGSSDGHIGYNVVTPGSPYSSPWTEPWKDAQQYESHWSWYDCALPPGSSHVRFSGASGFDQPKIGVWLWSEEHVGSLAQPLRLASLMPAMPQYNADIERQGICLRPSSHIL